MLTPSKCRLHSAECRRLAEQTSNARVKDILLDMARTWTRLALEAEQWNQENSPTQRLAKKPPPKVASGSFAPVLFSLPLHGGSLRILELEPVRRPPRPIARSQPFRDDAFDPHLAGVLEDRLTAVVAPDVRSGERRAGFSLHPPQRRLANFNGLSPQVHAV